MSPIPSGARGVADYATVSGRTGPVLVDTLLLRGLSRWSRNDAAAYHHQAKDLRQAVAGSAVVSPTPSEPSEDAGSLADVEGIGPERAAVLRKAGVRSAADLLKQGATVAGRRKLAKDTAFSSSLILTWVNNVDLFRVIGVGGEYAELLELAGVDSVPELARRNPKDLHAKLTEVNSEHNVVRRVPPPTTVSKWIAGAKGLPRAVQH